ncbi:MAG: hypothetical protein QM820_22340 [Minicystis sp.]
MSLRPILLTAAVASLLLGVFWWSSTRALAARASTARVPAASEPVPAPAARDPRRAARARYRLSSVQRAALDGREVATVVVEGTWTTIERAEGRSEVQLAASRIEVKGDQAPSAADVAGPMTLSTREGVLRGIAFTDDTPLRARALLTGLATSFQATIRDEAAWTVEEEDLLGRYTASYRRSGDRVSRTRARYTRVRDARGLSAEGSQAIVPVESTEIRVDSRGVVSAAVRVGTRTEVGKGKSVLEMSLKATLVREDLDEVPLTAGLGQEPLPISDHADRGAIAHKRAEALVAGAGTPELLAEAARVAHLDAHRPDTGAQRTRAQQRLSALCELDASAAAAIAGAIRRDPRDGAAVGLLTGALSSSSAPAATSALASLLEGEPLPAEVRGLVLTHLALANAPSDESAAALTRALDGPSGLDAALALGAQARKLDGDGAGDDAVDELLARYARASAPDEKRVLLLALANTGSRKALPVLTSAIEGSSLDLSRAGAFGLRLIPGDDVDDLLLTLIQRASPVIVPAIEASAYRSPALWKPRLEAAQTKFASRKDVVDAIQTVLTRWANVTP